MKADIYKLSKEEIGALRFEHERVLAFVDTIDLNYRFNKEFSEIFSRYDTIIYGCDNDVVGFKELLKKYTKIEGGEQRIPDQIKINVSELLNFVRGKGNSKEQARREWDRICSRLILNLAGNAVLINIPEKSIMGLSEGYIQRDCACSPLYDGHNMLIVNDTLPKDIFGFGYETMGTRKILFGRSAIPSGSMSRFIFRKFGLDVKAVPSILTNNDEMLLIKHIPWYEQDLGCRCHSCRNWNPMRYRR